MRHNLLRFALAAGACFAQAPPPQPEVREHSRAAQEAMVAGRLDQAAHEFQTVLSMDPGNVDARANLGSIAYLKGDCATASRMFAPLVEEQPGLVKAQALLGLAEACQGRNREAAGSLKQAFPKLPQG